MATQNDWTPIEGGCPCKTIRYRIEHSPLIVHCCHCTWCQKETGSAFVLNVMVESDYVSLLSETKPALVPVPSESGSGQSIHRCPKCQVAVWSNYGGSGDHVRFVRAGTLDDPSKTPPNIHIYTKTKQPWLQIDGSIPIKEEYYNTEEVWSKASLQRREDLIKKLQS